MKKYKIRYDLVYDGLTNPVYRIEALKDFSDVKKGDIGGYVENESNLSHEGGCWIYNDAMVSRDSIVSDNATVSDCANVRGGFIYDNAKISGTVQVWRQSSVYGNAKVRGSATVNSNSQIFEDAEVFGEGAIGCHSKVHGDAVICGRAIISGEEITKTSQYFVIHGQQLRITIYKDSFHTGMRKIPIGQVDTLQESDIGDNDLPSVIELIKQAHKLIEE